MKHKRILGIMVVFSWIILCCGFMPLNGQEETIGDSYNRVVQYLETSNSSYEITYEEYIDAYDVTYGSYSDYADRVIALFEETPQAQPLIADGKYYYDTGMTCPSQANYSKYNLLVVATTGDIIYEAAGGFGIVGHIAIVEGVYTSSDGRRYIRLIEAGSFGVKRSILDDTRYDEKRVTILRARGVTLATRTAAVNFCISQLNKPYHFSLGRKQTSSSSANWYCSELVWAAYYNQGVNIESTAIGNDPGVSPNDILNCSNVYSVAVSLK